jgi:hypothetical protein
MTFKLDTLRDLAAWVQAFAVALLLSLAAAVRRAALARHPLSVEPRTGVTYEKAGTVTARAAVVGRATVTAHLTVV